MIELKHNFPQPTFKLEAGKSYRTVNGKRVDVYEVKDKAKATLNVHAFLHKLMPSGKTKLIWKVYMEGCSYNFMWGTSNLDIIDYWKD